MAMKGMAAVNRQVIVSRNTRWAGDGNIQSPQWDLVIAEPESGGKSITKPFSRVIHGNVFCR